MDRSAWLRERRDAVRAKDDTEAADYEANPYPTTSHTRLVDHKTASARSNGSRRLIPLDCDFEIHEPPELEAYVGRLARRLDRSTAVS